MVSRISSNFSRLFKPSTTIGLLRYLLFKRVTTTFDMSTWLCRELWIQLTTLGWKDKHPSDEFTPPTTKLETAQAEQSYHLKMKASEGLILAICDSRFQSTFRVNYSSFSHFSRYSFWIFIWVLKEFSVSNNSFRLILVVATIESWSRPVLPCLSRQSQGLICRIWTFSHRCSACF